MADDDLTCRSLTEHTLTGLGVEIHAVTNGQEAVEAFANHSFDLVLMDCHMPTLDGFGAALLIREIETRERRTPIVALTGTAFGVELDRCREVGMDGHLDKLSGPHELRQALAEWLQRVAQAEGTATPTGAPSAATVAAGAGSGAPALSRPAIVRAAERPAPSPTASGLSASSLNAPAINAPVVNAAPTHAQTPPVLAPIGAPAPHADMACLDISVLEDLRAFSSPDDDLVAELKASFETNVADQLPKLDAAARGGDAGTVRFIAHRLRGTCGNLGARRMQFLCERLEMLGREGVTAGSVELIDDLTREFTQARTALDAWLRGSHR